MEKEKPSLEGNIPPRPRQKSIWPFVLAAIIFVLAAVAGAIFASGSLSDKPVETKKHLSKPKKEETLLTASDKAIIMLMGVDERTEDVGRSDTLMIAAVDPKKNKVSLLSVPRDTRVRLKNYGYDKINAAYAYGGEPFTQRTVEEFLGVSIDHYIIVNVRSFVKIIDAIGGVDINVEKRMYYEDPWDDDGGLYIDLQPGLQHMDGKTAVTYVRFRDEEGDIGRIKRQQRFLQACMEKVTSPTIIFKLPTVAKEVFSSLKTDLSLRQLLEFAGTLREARSSGLTADMVPGRPLYIDGISYWIPDISKLRHTVADTLDVEVSSTMRSNFEREAREYENSIPASATDVPESDNAIGYSAQYEPPRRRRSYYQETPAVPEHVEATEDSSNAGAKAEEPKEKTESPPASSDESTVQPTTPVSPPTPNSARSTAPPVEPEERPAPSSTPAYGRNVKGL